MRKRRSNRCSQLTRSNQAVVMFAFSRIQQDWRTWWYRSMSLRTAMKLVAAGDAEELLIETENGPTVFFRETTPPGPMLNAERNCYQSPTTLTVATMNAVAIAEPGVRLTRAEKAHVDKFKVWPLIGDTKAVAIRPRMTDSERSSAQKLMTRPSTAGHCRSERREVRVLRNDPRPLAA